MRDPSKDIAPPAAPPVPPDPLASAIARSVGDLRHAAGLSERAAARKLGTSQTQLRRMEDPRYLPSLRSLARLAKVYGYELTVEFVQRGVSVAKSTPARAKDAKPKPKPAPKKRASASGSPSKARAGAPRRGRAAARGRARAAAPKRRS